MIDSVLRQVDSVAERFAADRNHRQRRRHLERDDFKWIAETGYLKLVVPDDQGGAFTSIAESVTPICEALRRLARGDSSVALVSAMHPAVLSYWLVAEAQDVPEFRKQSKSIFSKVCSGAWWGTVTSEPGSGGDVANTRTKAEVANSPLEFRLHGAKHFGSGSGVMDFMVTTAIPDCEDFPDWFFLDVRKANWDGSGGMRCVAEWDGHGMPATQSHAFEFTGYPATRIAWPGHLRDIAARSGPFIGCLFTAVIVGIVDAATEAARERLGDIRQRSAYEQTEWTRIEMETWLIEQAFEGIQRAVQNDITDKKSVLRGKTAVAELAETVLQRICRVVGGATFSRHSPFGYWFEDVRALGFLRPPWTLAFQQMLDLE